MAALSDTPQYVTVKQFTETQAAFTAGGLRSAIFYKGDELERAGAIARIGRRILINEPVFLQFVQSGGLRSVRGA
ncbi:hypothetical protein HF285_09890 [Acidithiobacillus ferrooxidans F221]|uniref:hypothetical protein n=1 Tax=Acidithiobacillus ferrooxidans TaxID=920 RepID=UPI001C06B699|nr:hypothetical protein [Acidithiobacillus ferrooxidans]MBU2808560.1 hypothetical protein [Acidithiobacillus ferrooxidans F221]